MKHEDVLKLMNIRVEIVNNELYLIGGHHVSCIKVFGVNSGRQYEIYYSFNLLKDCAINFFICRDLSHFFSVGLFCYV